jgi:hypothetical protein
MPCHVMTKPIKTAKPKTTMAKERQRQGRRPDLLDARHMTYEAAKAQITTAIRVLPRTLCSQDVRSRHPLLARRLGRLTVTFPVFGAYAALALLLAYVGFRGEAPTSASPRRQWESRLVSPSREQPPGC